MAKTSADAFGEFHSKIRPTKDQLDTIDSRRTKTHEYLSGHFDDSDMPLDRTVLIGSAERNTIIRPLDDVDVMAVFSDVNNVYENQYSDDSFSFINRVRDALDDYHTDIVAGTRGQAVRLFYKSSPHVDIAPVFMRSGGGYMIPDGSGDWLITNPDEQSQYIALQDGVLNGHLKPFIRVIKKWNLVHSKRLHSFHLEVMATETFISMDGNTRDALYEFFLAAPNNIDVDDPAGHSGNLASYLTQDSRTALIDRFENAASRAASALEAAKNGNHQGAIRLWRIELGDDFPAYG